MQAIWTKLKNGSWGIKVTGYVPTAAGEKLQVTRKDGSQSTVEIEDILDQGNDYCICSIAKAAKDNDTCAECGKRGRLYIDPEDGQRKHYNCCDIPP